MPNETRNVSGGAGGGGWKPSALGPAVADVTDADGAAPTASTSTSTSTSTFNPTLEPILFWSHRTQDFRFLSQWFEIDFVAPVPNFSADPTDPSNTSSSIATSTSTSTSAPTSEPTQLTFSCCEQYMMYAKALLFHDADIAEQVLQARNPGKQKALGRQVAGFEEGAWEAWRERIVEDANWFKFTGAVVEQEEREGQKEHGAEAKKAKGKKSNMSIAEKLLATGEREIVEASPFDRIWGVGFAPDNAAANRHDWGLNLLGKALMRVRLRLRQEREQQRGEK